jgi:hypothetical protein
VSASKDEGNVWLPKRQPTLLVDGVVEGDDCHREWPCYYLQMSDANCCNVEECRLEAAWTCPACGHRVSCEVEENIRERRRTEGEQDFECEVCGVQLRTGRGYTGCCVEWMSGTPSLKPPSPDAGSPGDEGGGT